MQEHGGASNVTYGIYVDGGADDLVIDGNVLPGNPSGGISGPPADAHRLIENNLIH